MIRKRTFCYGNETHSRISRRKCVHESSGNPAGLLLPGTYAYLLVVFIKRMSVYYLWFILFTLLRSISESMNENIKIGTSFNSFVFIYADSDSSRTPSPPHYSRGGGRATFVLPESAPSHELETSSYYEEERILCWCVRCRGTYRRSRRQCRSHESEYGVFVDAPAPSQRHRPMVSVLYILSILFSFLFKEHIIISNIHLNMHVGICNFIG